MTTKSKVVIWLTTILVLALAGLVFFKWYFVYSEGVNDGDINYFQKEGVIFKTYEGKLILTGVTTTNEGRIKSNELKFSVKDPRIADQIFNSTTNHVKLGWKGYLGTLPWRGKSKCVVDSVYVLPEEPSIPAMPIDVPVIAE